MVPFNQTFLGYVYHCVEYDACDLLTYIMQHPEYAICVQHIVCYKNGLIFGFKIKYNHIYTALVYKTLTGASILGCNAAPAPITWYNLPLLRYVYQHPALEHYVVPMHNVVKQFEWLRWKQYGIAPKGDAAGADFDFPSISHGDAAGVPLDFLRGHLLETLATHNPGVVDVDVLVSVQHFIQ